VKFALNPDLGSPIRNIVVKKRLSEAIYLYSENCILFSISLFDSLPFVDSPLYWMSKMELKLFRMEEHGMIWVSPSNPMNFHIIITFDALFNFSKL